MDQNSASSARTGRISMYEQRGCAEDFCRLISTPDYSHQHLSIQSDDKGVSPLSEYNRSFLFVQTTDEWKKNLTHLWAAFGELPYWTLKFRILDNSPSGDTHSNLTGVQTPTHTKTEGGGGRLYIQSWYSQTQMFRRETFYLFTCTFASGNIFMAPCDKKRSWSHRCLYFLAQQVCKARGQCALFNQEDFVFPQAIQMYNWW